MSRFSLVCDYLKDGCKVKNMLNETLNLQWMVKWMLWCFPHGKGRYEGLCAPKHCFVLSRIETRLQNKNSQDADCMVRTRMPRTFCQHTFLLILLLTQKLVGCFGNESYLVSSFHSTLFTTLYIFTNLRYVEMK